MHLITVQTRDPYTFLSLSPQESKSAFKKFKYGSYPELYPKDLCVYNTYTIQQLFKKMKPVCKKPYLALHQWPKDLALEVCSKYSVEIMRPTKFKCI